MSRVLLSTIKNGQGEVHIIFSFGNFPIIRLYPYLANDRYSNFPVTFEIRWHRNMEISVQDPVVVSLAQLADCWFLTFPSKRTCNETN